MSQATMNPQFQLVGDPLKWRSRISKTIEPWALVGTNVDDFSQSFWIKKLAETCRNSPNEQRLRLLLDSFMPAFCSLRQLESERASRMAGDSLPKTKVGQLTYQKVQVGFPTSINIF